MSISFRTKPRLVTVPRHHKPIPPDTRRYILNMLQFAPVEKRKLERHMSARLDYRAIISSLMSQGLIRVTGLGKKGSPLVYSLKASTSAN